MACLLHENSINIVGTSTSICVMDGEGLFSAHTLDFEPPSNPPHLCWRHWPLKLQCPPQAFGSAVTMDGTTQLAVC